MYLNYSSIPFDESGRVEMPSLLLQTPDGTPIGILPGVSELKLTVKFAEASELTFRIAKKVDGEDNPFYDSVEGRMRVYTQYFGIFTVSEPQTESDGIGETKTVTCYSIEKRLEDKKLFLEEGTYNFYDPTNNTDTIIGRILEKAPEWKIGEVSPALIGKYRTFDEYSDNVYSFIGGDASEKFRCVFVFDPYEMAVNVLDADEERTVLPIYLDFDNLVTELNTTELTDELVTAMRPSGADGLGINEVNPIGSGWLYNIDYYIENGYIDAELAAKWEAWQSSVSANRQYFSGLVALRASASASLLARKAELTEIEYEIDGLKTQQSVTIETMAREKTDDGKQVQQTLLDEINAELADARTRQSEKEQDIADLESSISGEDSYTTRINSLVATLALENYFTEEEQATLRHYFVEQELVDETFVATDVDASAAGASSKIATGSVAITGSSITQIELTEFSKSVYAIEGGRLSVPEMELSANIIRATAEVKGESFVMSVYAGDIVVGTNSLTSGMLTLSGVTTSIVGDISRRTVNGLEELSGTQLTVSFSDTSAYLTANVSDYQKYAVQEELYQYAYKTLLETATPVYEFTVESGNFLFSREFDAFRDRLELGCGLYLRLNDERVIAPNLIEFSLSFEDESEFSLVFSNRFTRKDHVNTLKDMIESSYSSSRSLDASKYIYNKTSSRMSQVTQMLSGALDTAVNTVIGASNQSVQITGAGIEIGGDDDCQMRIVNKMIAITDDNWAHAKLAIGKFATDDGGEYFGVHADVIGGKLIVGNNLIIENEQVDASGNPTGVMQFKVDSTGAWLNNSTFVLQKDNGGRLILDPKYGIAGGTSLLFDTNGTTVIPSFVGEDGELILDDVGMPEDANFYFDINTGDAYFRGTVYATDGVFSGTVYATDGEFTGTVHATAGEFSGTLQAATLKGNLISDDDDGGWLIGCGIDVNDGAFYVDREGNVTMKGNINLSSGNITWGADSSPVCVLYAASSLSTPTGSYSSYPSTSSSGWHKTIGSSDLYASYSYDGGSTWTSAVKIRGEDGKNGSDGSDANVPAYIQKTYIDFSKVETPMLIANYVKTLGQFQVGHGSASNFESVGYMGAATGSGSLYGVGDVTTYGIAMSTTSDTITASTEGQYMIVTNAGVRMTYNDGSNYHAIYVNQRGAWVDHGDGDVFEIGSGTAVFA